VAAKIDDPGDSNLKLSTAAYRIDRDQSPPLIKRVGGLTGQAAQGRHLWLVSKSLESSHDSADPPHPGTERYFAVSELKLDDHGCWAVEGNVGYDEAVGLVFRDTIVDVDDQTSALFRAPGPEALSDGFDQHILQTQSATVIATFDVAT
jgi:hypothetical protein